MLDTDVRSTCLSKGDEVSAALAMRETMMKGIRAMKAMKAVKAMLFRGMVGLLLLRVQAGLGFRVVGLDLAV